MSGELSSVLMNMPHLKTYEVSSQNSILSESPLRPLLANIQPIKVYHQIMHAKSKCFASAYNTSSEISLALIKRLLWKY